MTGSDPIGVQLGDSDAIVAQVVKHTAVLFRRPVRARSHHVLAAARELIPELVDRQMQRLGDLLAKHGRPDPGFLRDYRKQLTAECAVALAQISKDARETDCELLSLQVSRHLP